MGELSITPHAVRRRLMQWIQFANYKSTLECKLNNWVKTIPNSNKPALKKLMMDSVVEIETTLKQIRTEIERL